MAQTLHETWQKRGEPSPVDIGPIGKDVGHVTFGHRAQPASDFGSGSGDLHDDCASVLRVSFPSHESICFQLGDLPAGSGGVHLREASELTNLDSFLSLNSTQQLESGLRYHHAGRSSSALVHFAAGVQAKQLLERSLDGAQIVRLF